MRGVFVFQDKKTNNNGTKDVEKKRAVTLFAEEKSSGNKSSLTSVGTCLLFASVGRLFDLLALSYRNEPLGVPAPTRSVRSTSSSSSPPCQRC